jgi:hypothetical protein
VATSPADLGHRIERVDGPDQAKRGFFAKKPSYLSEINPQSYFLSRFIFQKNPRLLPKSTRSPCLLMGLSFVLLGRPAWNGPKTARETLLL